MKNNKSDIDNILKQRITIITIIFIVCFFVIMLRLGYLQTFNYKASVKNLENLSTKKVYSASMPRGRIFDRNYRVIVDNIGVKSIVYKRDSGIRVNDEVNLAKILAKSLDVNYSKVTTNSLKDFWIVCNYEEAKQKITKEEYELYERRKLKQTEIEKLKKERITKEELSTLTEEDKEAAYIYYLMNKGYSYDEKTIKSNISDDEYTFIIENEDLLSGVKVATTWERIYPYGDVLKQILGTVSTSEQGIPNELKASYLNKGYALNDRVGLSYLEKEYEDELKGVKAEYEIKNGVKKLVKEGSRGNDIVLSIDIELQKELENIIAEELVSAKKEANTENFNHSSVVISDPKTGEILAMASKQIVDVNGEYKVYDYTTSLLTTSNTPGSIVKGASMLVGYSTGNLKIGDAFYDKCIKFKNTPLKCSWSNSLGTLNDITALTYSSNSYQFQLALKVAGLNYYYNMPAKVPDDSIDIYRNVFKQLGLGVKTGIDLPNESNGYAGSKVNAGLLLNYSIGQYDTYTTLQLAQYVNTLASGGTRFKLNLVKEIRNASKNEELGTIKKTYEKTVLNTTNIDKIYFDRVKEGFKSVMKGYLGKGYMGNAPEPAGKTGTSESFYDASKDGVVDTETYSKSFVGYAPADNPVMSIAAISPHVRTKKSSSSFTSNINKRITSRICNKFFEIYQ